MKNSFCFALIVVALCAGAAAAFVFMNGDKTDVESKTIRMAVFVYKGSDTFIENVSGALMQTAAEYTGANGEKVYMAYLDANDSQSLQNEQIARYISLNYDVLCVNLVDRIEAAYVIDIAKEANVPVVFFNREPVKQDMTKWERTVYVGTDAKKNAELEAEVVLQQYRRDPYAIDKNQDGIVNYIMIEGERRHQDTLIRTEVSVQTLRDNGMELERLDGGIANWTRSQAAALAEQYFNSYGDAIELIICNNDDMALGVVDTIDRLGIDFVNIVGVDGTPQGIEAVKSGKMLGTVSIGCEEHAQLIFDMALALYHQHYNQIAEVAGEDGAVRAPLNIITSTSY